MTSFNRDHMQVARVLADDGDQITLEILKDKTKPYTLDPETPDRFFTILFIHQPPGASEPEVWIPWEAESEGT